MYAKQAITDITKAYRSTIVSSVATTSFEVTAKRSMTAFSQMSGNDPNVLEKEKNKNLNAKDKEWNENLASHSEAAVKADKEHDKPVKHLQDETIKHLEKKDREDK